MTEKFATIFNFRTFNGGYPQNNTDFTPCKKPPWLRPSTLISRNNHVNTATPPLVPVSVWVVTATRITLVLQYSHANIIANLTIHSSDDSCTARIFGANCRVHILPGEQRWQLARVPIATSELFPVSCMPGCWTCDSFMIQDTSMPGLDTHTPYLLPLFKYYISRCA